MSVLGTATLWSFSPPRGEGLLFAPFPRACQVANREQDVRPWTIAQVEPPAYRRQDPQGRPSALRFYGLLTFFIAFAALLVFIPGLPLSR